MTEGWWPKPRRGWIYVNVGALLISAAVSVFSFRAGYTLDGWVLAIGAACWTPGIYFSVRTYRIAVRALEQCREIDRQIEEQVDEFLRNHERRETL